MADRSDEELERICTLEAADYTPEAIEAARTELGARGRDARVLVAATEPTHEGDRSFDAAQWGFALLALAMLLGVVLFFVDDPLWRLIVELSIGAAALAGSGALTLARHLRR